MEETRTQQLNQMLASSFTYTQAEVNKMIAQATQKAREEERKSALEIAKTYIINRKIGKPTPLIISENTYKKLLKLNGEFNEIDASQQEGQK